MEELHWLIYLLTIKFTSQHHDLESDTSESDYVADLNFITLKRLIIDRLPY